MSVYKVVVRNPKTNLQEIKKIYETDKKYKSHGVKAINRYILFGNVEVYILNDKDEWELKCENKKLSSEEDVWEYALINNFTDSWADYYIKNNL